jgi:hypothetical protein
MKLSGSISAVAIAMVATLGGVSVATALEAYKTKKDQVVVTGLKAQKKYDVQYKNALGKDGKRKVDTNTCGEALIDKVGKFQSVMIDGQNINPQTLTVKEHQRCSAAKKKVVSNQRILTPQSSLRARKSPKPINATSSAN